MNCVFNFSESDIYSFSEFFKNKSMEENKAKNEKMKELQAIEQERDWHNPFKNTLQPLKRVI